MKTGRCPECKRVRLLVKVCHHDPVHRFSATGVLCPEPDYLIRKHGTCGRRLRPVVGSMSEATYKAVATSMTKEVANVR